ncbi:hypothetical protein O181_019705 [Austropuccinia psidii MF-1]|uniref:Uncharacterized protein n=1 Tax=Austropuccinia psidii MF-1 TaxID=1389203 RepID=A0A9Q3CB77_9BASI|nr:hypothetical protein [Austropuccinia psidii MF-1]
MCGPWAFLWPHGPPGTQEYRSILSLGDSNNPHRPQTVGHQKAPNHNSIKNDHSNGQDPKCSRGFKIAKYQGQGDKPDPWMMPKVNQDEKDPRGPTGWEIMGI